MIINIWAIEYDIYCLKEKKDVCTYYIFDTNPELWSKNCPAMEGISWNKQILKLDQNTDIISKLKILKFFTKKIVFKLILTCLSALPCSFFPLSLGEGIYIMLISLMIRKNMFHDFCFYITQILILWYPLHIFTCLLLSWRNQIQKYLEVYFSWNT